MAEAIGQYEKTGMELGALCDKKNRFYGDSFRKSGQLLRELYPDGVNPEQYDDMLAIVRIIDKLFRIATDRDALGESPWIDIGGYSILRATQLHEKNEGINSRATKPTEYIK